MAGKWVKSRRIVGMFSPKRGLDCAKNLWIAELLASFPHLPVMLMPCRRAGIVVPKPLAGTERFVRGTLASTTAMSLSPFIRLSLPELLLSRPEKVVSVYLCVGSAAIHTQLAQTHKLTYMRCVSSGGAHTPGSL